MGDTLNELERQRRYFETLIEVSPTAIVRADPAFVVTSWNPAAERLFGYPADEAVGRHIDELIADDPDVREEATRLSDDVRSGPTQLITRRVRKDGSFVDVAVRSAPIIIDGQMVGVYAFYEDIGELVRQTRFFESLLEVSPAAVAMVDGGFLVTSWNPAAETLFGYTSAEAIGTPIDDLVARSPEVREEATAWSEEAWRSDLWSFAAAAPGARALPSFHRIGRRERKDGTTVDVEISAVRVMHEGEAIAYVVYHDITELEHTRRQLEARIDEQMAELVRTGELARFLPRQVAEGLLAGQLAPEDGFERRKLTVLFADMVGFTDLTESLEPEELSEVLNEYLRQMTAAVVAHGGTLDNFIGDGIMAIFGAPDRMPEGEQAWAAMRTAIEMRRRCRDLAAQLRGRGIPADLDIRVGLNTGHCTVGVFGSEVMRAYKAVGFAVNVAARLQSAGEPGSILCGFRTYALIQDRVHAVAQEPLLVKGSSRPVEAWSILDLIGREVQET
jgi:PAS domain S-box-containing protein